MSHPISTGRRRVPRPLPGHTGPLAPAYQRAYHAFVGQYGWPPSRSRFEAAMIRCAIAEARLVGARIAWAALENMKRRNKARRAELLAADKTLGRADESLSRALADLRSVMPVAPKRTKAELEHEEEQRAFAEGVARGWAPPSKPGEPGRRAAQAETGRS